MPRRFLFAAIAGLSLGIFLGEVAPMMFIILGVVVVVLIFSWYSYRTIAGVLAIGVLLGAWRLTNVMDHYDQSVATIMNHPGSINGVISRSWFAYGRRVVEIGQLAVDGQSLAGSVQTTLSPDSSVHVGAEVVVGCRWQSMQPAQRLSRAAQGLLVSCRAPDEFTLGTQSRTWRTWLVLARTGLVDHINRSYHPPQSDLLAGILLGVQETMTTELRASFRATGTSHIVALSGFNVTIIITILAAALRTVIGRRLSFWPTTMLVIGFVIMTGASASVTRAAVMALLGLIAGQLGRPVLIARIILYAFGGMVLMNPLILLHDLGFQLSFLATLGLIYVSPAVEQRFRRLPEGLAIRSNLSSTLAAMVVTEPLLLWLFGRLSIVAPAVNLFVLPFVPLIMALGAVALIVPWAVPVTDALLRFVLGGIGTAAGWPIAQVATPWWVAGCIAGACVWLVIHFVHDSHKETLSRR